MYTNVINTIEFINTFKSFIYIEIAFILWRRKREEVIDR